MVGKARIRIAVVDDQAIVRTGLTAFLQADRNLEVIEKQRMAKKPSNYAI